MTQRYEQRNAPVLDRLLTIEVPGEPLDPPEFAYGTPLLGPDTTMRLWASRRGTAAFSHEDERKPTDRLLFHRVDMSFKPRPEGRVDVPG